MEEYFQVLVNLITSLTTISENCLNRALHASRINTNKPQWKHKYNKGPLVLTYDPCNAGTRRILLDNFNIFPNLRWYHIGVSENSVIYSYTTLMPRRLRPTAPMAEVQAQHPWPLHLSVCMRMLCIAFLVVAAIAYTSDKRSSVIPSIEEGLSKNV